MEPWCVEEVMNASVRAKADGRILRAVLVAGLITATACAPAVVPPAYPAYQTGQAMSVQQGVVQSVRSVRIQGYPTGAGAAVGSTVGAIAGAAAGSNSSYYYSSGSWWGALAGAIIGGLAGNAMETAAAQQNGLEVQVRLDDGRVLVIVQGGEELFRPGDDVDVLTAPDGSSRVQHPRR